VNPRHCKCKSKGNTLICWSLRALQEKYSETCSIAPL